MILIAVAPNGARKTKADLPSIPLTAEEIGLEAKACQQAGASMIHLHVRNAKGEHSLNSELYQDAIEQIKLKTEGALFIQVTSEAVGKYSPDEQFEMIYRLKPQGVSIGLREIRSFDRRIIRQHFNWMRENEVYPQLILYNQYDVQMYQQWLEEEVLPGKAYPVLMVIGKHQKEGVFDAKNISALAKVPVTSLMVCAFGEQEFSVGKLAVSLGKHIRLGFENNHLLKDGSNAKNNAEIIQQMADYLEKNGEEPASYKDACKLMKPDW